MVDEGFELVKFVWRKMQQGFTSKKSGVGTMAERVAAICRALISLFVGFVLVLSSRGTV